MSLAQGGRPGAHALAPHAAPPMGTAAAFRSGSAVAGDAPSREALTCVTIQSNTDAYNTCGETRRAERWQALRETQAAQRARRSWRLMDRRGQNWKQVG
eukprot:361365-Chlamydomonas_euryale.AAC.2